MPVGVVTVTFTVPALAAGDVAVIWVPLSTLKLAAAVPPKLTAVAPVKPVPVRTTVVPPVVGPPVGDSPVTVGATIRLLVRLKFVDALPAVAVTE